MAAVASYPCVHRTGTDLQIVEILHAGIGDSEFHERFEFSGNHRFFWLGGVRGVPRDAYSFPPQHYLSFRSTYRNILVVWQTRPVPSAAEGFNQQHSIRHTASQNVDCR